MAVFEGAFQNIVAVQFGDFSPVRGVSRCFPWYDGVLPDLGIGTSCSGFLNTEGEPFGEWLSDGVSTVIANPETHHVVLADTYPQDKHPITTLFLRRPNVSDACDRFGLGGMCSSTPAVPNNQNVPVGLHSVRTGVFRGTNDPRSPYEGKSYVVVEKAPGAVVKKLGDSYGVDSVVFKYMACYVVPGSLDCYNTQRMRPSTETYIIQVDASEAFQINWDSKVSDTLLVFGDAPDEIDAEEFWGYAPALYETDRDGNPVVKEYRYSPQTQANEWQDPQDVLTKNPEADNAYFIHGSFGRTRIGVSVMWATPQELDTITDA